MRKHKCHAVHVPMRRRGPQWSQRARCHPRRTWHPVEIRAIISLARCSRSPAPTRLYSANLDPRASIALGDSPQRRTALLVIVDVHGQLHILELLPATHRYLFARAESDIECSHVKHTLRDDRIETTDDV